MLEDVERSLEVRITIGPVHTNTMSREIPLSRFVQTERQFVGKAVVIVGVGTPTCRITPFVAFASRINVYAYKDSILHRSSYLTSKLVGPVDTLLKGDVVFFRDKQLCIVTSALKVHNNCSGYFTVVLVLPEATIRRAFARGFDPVAIIN